MTATLEPTTTVSTTEIERRDALAERVVNGLLESLELVTVHLGVELGLYAALATEGAATPPELAARAGIHPRYAREWLEQQAAAGILDVVDDPVAETGTDDPDAVADARRFALPPGHAEALVDPDSPAAIASIPSNVIGIIGALDGVAAAYRSGGGVHFGDYGPGIRHGIGGMNRPMFTHELASWIAAAPGVDARLRILSEPRILDLGCGTGWSTIALARAYPHARVTGVDLDEASIEDALRNAAAAGVGDQVSFEQRDAVTIHQLGGSFDLVCIFEALHDMAHPVQALQQVRGVLADGASLVLADERVGDVFTAPADVNDRLMYAFSVSHCLPATMAEEPTVATGTAIRRSTVELYATEAGFGSVDELATENPFWRLYHLVP